MGSAGKKDLRIYKTIVMTSYDEQMDRRMMYFTVLDILFMPYFFLVTITYSFATTIWWYQKRLPYFRADKDHQMFKKMSVLIVLSAFVGIILSPDSAKDNLVFALQFIVSFMHLFVFKYYFDHYSFNLKPFLLCFAAFAAGLALVFTFDLGLYYELRHIWTPIQSTVDEDFMAGLIRYGFVWMDENNIAYMMNAVMLFIICNERSALYEKFFVIICAIIVNMCSMSRGGMLTLYSGIGIYLVFLFTGNRIKRTIRSKSKLLSIFFFAFIAAAVVHYAPSYLDSEVSQSSKERMEERGNDNRKEIYTRILKHADFHEYLIVGHGMRTKVLGKVQKPHSVHLFWILAYGFISYYYMLYILFRKRKPTKWFEFLWIWPFFFGATINIIIGEEKAMCLALLLIAASSSPKYLEERRN